ncbi:response regulator transcription factor [Vibrio sp. NH-7]
MVKNKNNGEILDVVLVGFNCIQNQFIRREIEKKNKFRFTRKLPQYFCDDGVQTINQRTITLVSYNVLSNATSELIDFFSQETATLIVYDVPETGVDIELCRYRGLKGILYQEAPIDHLFRCLDAVSNNDMWLPRKLMVKMLNEFRPYAINYQELNTTLTKREQQTLERIIQGQSNLEIAEALFVAESTVKTHVYKLYKKLNVRCRKEVINKVSNQFFEHSN